MWDSHALLLASYNSRCLLAGWSPVSLPRPARTQRHLGRCPIANPGLGPQRVPVCRWVVATAAGRVHGHPECPLVKQQQRRRERGADAARCEWKEWTTSFRRAHIEAIHSSPPHSWNRGKPIATRAKVATCAPQRLLQQLSVRSYERHADKP